MGRNFEQLRWGLNDELRDNEAKHSSGEATTD